MSIRSRTSLFRSTWPSFTHPSMAAHLPCLPGSPSVSKGVLTSFVPSAHIQGASAAPLQGHALWKRFLPATGSFFVVLLTIRFPYQHLTADVFLICSPSCHSPSGAGLPVRDRSQISTFWGPGSGREQVGYSLSQVTLSPVSECLQASWHRHNSRRYS